MHVDEEFARAVQRLLDFPESGRPGRIEGTRELSFMLIPIAIVCYFGLMKAQSHKWTTSKVGWSFGTLFAPERGVWGIGSTARRFHAAYSL